MTPDVDVIIAIHDLRRPIERAVGSVLDHNHIEVRLTVVCHGIPVEAVAGRLGNRDRDPRLRFISVDDGIQSPAGPLNAGLEAATARFVSVMGSDDELEPRAIDAWVELAEHDHADIVIARLRYAGGAFVPTPPVRPWRRRELSGVRDRLSYRSAPLGIVGTQLFGDARFTAGVATGEDVAYVTAMWFSGARISYARTRPAYLVHDDADSRASSTTREISADLAFVPLLLASSTVELLHESAKLALAAKLWRINVFGAVHNRRLRPFTAAEKAWLADLCIALTAFAPTALRVLSRADVRLIKALSGGAPPNQTLVELSDRRRRFTHPSSLVSQAPLATLTREAPIRMIAATALQSRGRRKESAMSRASDLAT
jgi:hypothetical protein